MINDAEEIKHAPDELEGLWPETTLSNTELESLEAMYRKCKLYREADEVYRRRLLDQKKQQGDKS